MSSARIDPKSVAAWFEAHPDVLAIRSRFAEFSRDEAGRPVQLWGCCGLASRVADDPRFPPAAMDVEFGDGADETRIRRIASALEIGPCYAEGFCMGWDGHMPPPFATHPVGLGHADGRAAYRLTIEARRS